MEFGRFIRHHAANSGHEFAHLRDLGCHLVMSSCLVLDKKKPSSPEHQKRGAHGAGFRALESANVPICRSCSVPRVAS
jgi:hypothetical protein